MSERSILVGKRIKQLRLQKGLNQSELANKINVSQAHMSNMERGYSNITMENLLALHDVLEVPMAEIFKDIDNGYGADKSNMVLNSQFTISDLLQALVLMRK